MARLVSVALVLVALSVRANELLTVQLNPPESNADVSASDQSLKITFAVTNPTGSSVRLLMRETPLEGMLCNMFVVRDPAGNVMSYRGKDVKRVSTPSLSEWVDVEAGGRLEREIRIGGRYQLGGEGVYTISMRQTAHQLDVSQASTTVTVTGTEAYELRHSEAAAARIAQRKQLRLLSSRRNEQIATDSCSAAKITELTNWDIDAWDKIQVVRECTTTGCSTLVDTWFGPSTSSSQLTTVTDKFDTMSARFHASVYKCAEDSPSHCKGDVYAYVYPSDETQTIYMCQFTFDYPDYAEKVQTVIHELSHFNEIGATNDNAYGEQTCYQLANGGSADFAKALTTADTFGYFAIYVNSCYRRAPSGYQAFRPPCKSCSAQSSQYSTTAINCATSSAPTITASPTSVDSCQYANEGACDEPTYCAIGTDCTDCGNCRSGSPTAAPTAAQVSAAFSIRLEGTASSSFSTSAQLGFKTVVASNSGSVCGVNGYSPCTSSHVTIITYSRRTLTVSFALDTESASSASSAYSSLTSYLVSNDFLSDLTTAGSVTATSSQIIFAGVTTIQPTPAVWSSTNVATTARKGGQTHPASVALSLTFLVFVLAKYFN